MKFKELSTMGEDERKNKLKELELELIKLNTQVATGTPPKNAGIVRRIKKDIARIMLINGRQEKAPIIKKNISTMGKSQKEKKDKTKQ